MMNDFTKDELERIYISVHVANILRDFDGANSLKHKIQSMIDNYCEHDWEITGYRHDRCTKCGRVS